MAGIAVALAVGGLALLLAPDEEAPAQSVNGAESEGVKVDGPPRVTFDGDPQARDRAQAGEDATSLSAALQPDGAGASESSATGSAQGRSGDLDEPILGVVIDPQGAPIYMAKITEIPPKSTRGKGRETTTNAQGQFSLSRVPPGGRIGVSARGFMGRILPLGKKPAGLVKVELLPVKEISVLVLDGETGLPIEGASVRVKSGGNHSDHSTNKMGVLDLSVATESVSLDIWFKERVSQIWHDGYPTTVSLQRGRAVRGDVVAADGSPAPAVPVIVVGRGQRRWPQKTKTDSDGRFDLPGGIARGEQFSVFAWDQASATPLKYDWFPAGENRVLVKMEARGGAEFFGNGGPEDEHLRPFPVLPLGLDPNRTSFRRWKGHVSFVLLAPGPYRLRSPNRETYGDRFEVEPGDITRVEWKAKPGLRRRMKPRRWRKTVSGSKSTESEGSDKSPKAAMRVVLEAAVEPLQPVEIRVRRGRRLTRTVQAPEGTFRLTNLPPGAYRLEIRRQDGQTFLLDVMLPRTQPITIPIADED